MTRAVTHYFFLVLLLFCNNVYAQWEFKHPQENLSSSWATIFMKDEHTAFISLEDCGRMLRTTDGGKSWHERHFSDRRNYTPNVMCFADAQHVWSGNAAGYVAHSADGGDTWENHIFGSAIVSMSFFGSRNGWILTANQVLHRTVDGGKTWDQVPCNLVRVLAVGPQKLLGHSFGWAYKMYSTDGGSTWQELGKRTPEEFFYEEPCNVAEGYLVNGSGLYSVKEREHYIPGHISSNFATVNPSHTWTMSSNKLSFYADLTIEQKRSFPSSVYTSSVSTSIAFFTGEHGLISTSYSIYETYDGGKSWQELFAYRAPREYFPGLCFTSNTEGYTVSANYGSILPDFRSRLYETKNGGESWLVREEDTHYNYTSIAVPGNNILVTTSEGVVLRQQTNGTNRTATVLHNKALLDIDFFSNGAGIACGERGGLFRTIDRGNTWDTLQLNDTNNLRRIFCVSDQQTAFMIGPPGYLYKTADQGINWQRLDLPDSLFYAAGIWFINKDTGAVVVNRFSGFSWKSSVLKTYDGGNTWHFESVPVFGNAFSGVVESVYMDTTVLLVGKEEGLYSKRPADFDFNIEYLKDFATVTRFAKKPNGEIWCTAFTTIMKRINMQPFRTLLPVNKGSVSRGNGLGLSFSWEHVPGAYEYRISFRSADTTAIRSCSDYLRKQADTVYEYWLDAAQASGLLQELGIKPGQPAEIRWTVWAINPVETVKAAESSFIINASAAPEPVQEMNLQLIPNPAGQHVLVTLPFKVTGSLQVGIYDTQGKELQARQIEQCDCGDVVLDTSRLAPGLYFVKATYAGQAASEKLVIYR